MTQVRPSAFNHLSIRSRRLRYAAHISLKNSGGVARAMSAPHCEGVDTPLVEYKVVLRRPVIHGCSLATTCPTRHPVIEYDFERVKDVNVRSNISGREAMETCSPS